MPRAASQPALLGWKEKVHFPSWNLTLKALMDPASALSTLAVERVEALGRMKDERGRRRRVLRLAVPVARGKERVKRVYAYYHRRTRLGEGLGRCYVVKVPVRIGSRSLELELALVPAQRRRYFLHLGRGDLAGRFRLDPAQAYRHAVLRRPFEPEPSLPLPEVEER
jgi:hypothetical protein